MSIIAWITYRVNRKFFTVVAELLSLAIGILFCLAMVQKIITREITFSFLNVLYLFSLPAWQIAVGVNFKEDDFYIFFDKFFSIAMATAVVAGVCWCFFAADFI